MNRNINRTYRNRIRTCRNRNRNRDRDRNRNKVKKAGTEFKKR